MPNPRADGGKQEVSKYVRKKMAIIVTLPGTQKYLGISSMVVGGKKLFQSPVPPTYCTSFIVNKYNRPNDLSTLLG